MVNLPSTERRTTQAASDNKWNPGVPRAHHVEDAPILPGFPKPQDPTRLPRLTLCGHAHSLQRDSYMLRGSIVGRNAGVRHAPSFTRIGQVHFVTVPFSSWQCCLNTTVVRRSIRRK